jgi:hypothetical protein
MRLLQNKRGRKHFLPRTNLFPALTGMSENEFASVRSSFQRFRSGKNSLLRTPALSRTASFSEHLVLAESREADSAMVTP